MQYAEIVVQLSSIFCGYNRCELSKTILCVEQLTVLSVYELEIVQKKRDRWSVVSNSTRLLCDFRTSCFGCVWIHHADSSHSINPSMCWICENHATIAATTQLSRNSCETVARQSCDNSTTMAQQNTHDIVIGERNLSESIYSFFLFLKLCEIYKFVECL